MNLGGCPFKIRGDMGTENGHTAEMQHFLSRKKSFINGKSSRNKEYKCFRNISVMIVKIWIEIMCNLVVQEMFQLWKS